MILKSLVMEQYRGFDARTTIEFDDRFTLIVGENGVGKTSVLSALRVLLSRIVAKVVDAPVKRLSFSDSDIASGWPYARVEVAVELEPRGPTVTAVGQKHEGSFVLNAGKYGLPRAHAVSTPDIYDVSLGSTAVRRKGRAGNEPLAIYYSAHRSLAVERSASKARAGGGLIAARADALDERELLLGEAALLWRKEEALETSDARPARANVAIERALPAFLGDIHNIRTEGDEHPRLVVDKRRTRLDLAQLSEGERGLLAILMDLTRRLGQANPTMAHPAREASAIVLIDEIDLHMHPRWQRAIVSRMLRAFPKCQFVATSHSPLVVSEMQPDRLILLRQVGRHVISERCGQAYGLDVSYVLEHIMGAAPRAGRATRAIHAVEDALELGHLTKARKLLRALRTMLHGDDTAVVGLEATINNLEALGNARHKQKK